MAGTFPRSLSELNRQRVDENVPHAVDVPPKWFDATRFEKGRAFFFANIFAIVFSYIFALLVGFVVEPLARSLLFTGKSVGAAPARARYSSTIAHIFEWFRAGDVFAGEEKGTRSLRRVREMHTAVSSAMSGASMFGQYDMALTQCGFVSTALHPRLWGIADAGEEELEGFVHFWAVIACALGVRDEFNVCAGGLESTLAVCREIEQEVIAKGLRERPVYAKQLADDFVDGLRLFGGPLALLSRAGLFLYVFPVFGLRRCAKDVDVEVLRVRDWILFGALKVHVFLMLYVRTYKQLCNRVVRERLEFFSERYLKF